MGFRQFSRISHRGERSGTHRSNLASFFIFIFIFFENHFFFFFCYNNVRTVIFTLNILLKISKNIHLIILNITENLF